MDNDNKPTTDQVQADKRKSLRSPLLTLRVRIDDGSKVFFGYAKNISRSGMFIASINPKDAGKHYQVEIPFPEPVGQTVQVTCEVIWNRQFEKKSTHEPGMGLRFIDMPDNVASAIDSWVQQSG